jgi:hypothetical protein
MVGISNVDPLEPTWICWSLWTFDLVLAIVSWLNFAIDFW